MKKISNVKKLNIMLENKKNIEVTLFHIVSDWINENVCAYLTSENCRPNDMLLEIEKDFPTNAKMGYYNDEKEAMLETCVESGLLLMKDIDRMSDYLYRERIESSRLRNTNDSLSVITVEYANA